MKRKMLLLFFASLLFTAFACNDDSHPTGGDDKPSSVLTPDNSTSGITYQLLVYSFADSDGDGVGDFNGIASKLDYLKEMGVGALWLSPINSAGAYHGYDALDYASVNPDYGTEDDFRNLVAKAHEKGIRIYLDYVLNHTSANHPWFLSAKASADSEYRDYYIFSQDPLADIRAGKIPMIATEGNSGYDSGQWFSVVSGGKEESMKVKFTLKWGNAPTLTIEKVATVTNSGTQNSGKYLYYGNGSMVEFYSNGSNTYTVSLDLVSSWGVLVRTSKTTWDGGTKWGAPAGSNRLEWGKALRLSSSDAQDILLPNMNSLMYHSHFRTGSFADINYGSAATCENSPTFKAVTEAADKWIKMGVDGFRLDAIKHIYHNADSDENPTFLRKFYDRCNATYHACGHADDIYMVGEHFSEASQVASYYKGLPAFFEFSFWWRLRDAINNGVGNQFAETIQGYQSSYAQYNPHYIEATKLTNHDEDRAASDLGRNMAKMKLAGAVLLTAGGEPYIYQGEELGYWGTRSKGDEYVRTPMMWTSSDADIAAAKLRGKVDRSMLTTAISVEAQSADASSILQTYRTFGTLRATYKALSKGSFVPRSVPANTSIAAWYREYEEQKVLVVHNFGSGTATVALPGDKLSTLIGSNGSVTARDGKLTLDAYSTAVYLQ